MNSFGLGLHDDFHRHTLMAGTANHGANDEVFAGLVGRRKIKLLKSWLQEQVPAGHGSVTGRQELEAVHRSIAIVILCLDGSDSEVNGFAGSERQDGLVLSRNFEATIVIRSDIDYAVLRLPARCKWS